jgi:16S rRNA (adenine1518-N6/adenine1519-N6)-dimethyltransferase
VDSAVVRLDFRPREQRQATDEALFRKIVRGTFAQRRKMIRNTLSNLFSSTILENLKFDFTRRPESFSVDEFVELSNVIHQRLAKDHGTHDQRN